MNVYCVTRNRSISTATLHTLLNINIRCMMNSLDLNIHFMDSKEPVAKLIEKGQTSVLFLDYGTAIDEATLDCILKNRESFLVFPAPLEGVDWDLFRKKTLAGSKEPVSQRALKFDVDVEGSDLSAFYVGGKKTSRLLREKKLSFPLKNTLEKLKAHGIPYIIYSKAVVTRIYPHECLGNILDVSGVNLEA